VAIKKTRNGKGQERGWTGIERKSDYSKIGYLSSSLRESSPIPTPTPTPRKQLSHSAGSEDAKSWRPMRRLKKEEQQSGSVEIGIEKTEEE
jgi:hypothetical protein